MKENKKAISTMSKMIIVMQLAIVVGALGFVMISAPEINYPRNGEVLETNMVNFEFRNANVILIDDNPDFSNAREIDLRENETSQIIFEPGTYYWKAVGLLESESNEFVIPTNVGLRLTNSSLKNVGDVPIKVSSKNESGISGLAILDVNVEYEVENEVENESKTIYRGEEYEN